jgi:hypothetical protein
LGTSGDLRAGLLAPFEDWQSIGTEGVISRMRDLTPGPYTADTPEHAAASAIVIAVGNYAWLGADSDDKQKLIEAENTRLEEIDSGRSRYWG